MFASRTLVASLLFSLTACGSPNIGFGVAADLFFDGALPDSELARVTRFEFVASGDEQFTSEVPLSRMVARTERVAYRPLASTRSLTIDVSALDLGGLIVAAGRSELLTLTPGATTSAEIILTSPSMIDGGQVDGADGSTVPSGPSRCGTLVDDPTVIACAGFESTADQLTAYNMTGATLIDDTHVFRGRSSMHLVTKGDTTSERTFAEVHQQQLPTAGMYAARAFYYIPAAPPSGTRLVDFQQDGSAFRAVDIGIRPNGKLFMAHSGVGGAMDKFIVSTHSVPLGRWVCLELQVTWGDASTGRVRVYVDDVLVDDLNDDSATLDSPPINYSIDGLFFDPSPGSEYDVWLDELVLATAPIGCMK